MNWPAYEEYIDSGVVWLGLTPRKWTLCRLKHVASAITSGTSVNGADVPAGPDEVGVLKTSCVSAGWFNAEANKTVMEDGLERVSVPVTKGTLVVNRANTPSLVGSAGYVAESLPNLFLSDKLWQVTFSGALAEFVFYWTGTVGYRAQIAANCVGASSSMQNLSMSDFEKIAIALPSMIEQRSIVAFLDHETAKIDALIAKQKQLIATLHEDRVATIIQAVTKGFDPAREVRDSEIDWMGQIPEHWKVVKLRHTAAMKTGHTPSRSVSEYWENTTIPWFTLADVWQLRGGRQIYLGKTANLISELGLQNSSAELLPSGTVVLSRTASVGFSGIMPRPMATSQDFWNWVCGPDLEPTYLVYVLRAMRPYFDSLMMGSTHQTIYQADAASIRVPLPPVQEQREIVKVLKTKVERMDALIDKSTEMIDILREYRSTLITDAVIGKIDVREVA